MLPMTANQRLPQNKISGLSIAYGKANYVYSDESDDGSEGFIFPEPEDFQWQLPIDHVVKELGVTMDALMDCIDQIETEIGDPQMQRIQYGLFDGSGIWNGGLVVRSNLDPRITCVFNPVSTEFELERFTFPKTTEGMFAWYFEADNLLDQSDDLPDFLSRFDAASGNRASNVLVSPVLPNYQEACEKLAGIQLTEGVRQTFLQKLWNYEKTVAPGFKAQWKKEILREWTALTSVRDAAADLEESLKKKLV